MSDHRFQVLFLNGYHGTCRPCATLEEAHQVARESAQRHPGQEYVVQELRWHDVRTYLLPTETQTIPAESNA